MTRASRRCQRTRCQTRGQGVATYVLQRDSTKPITKRLCRLHFQELTTDRGRRILGIAPMRGAA